MTLIEAYLLLLLRLGDQPRKSRQALYNVGHTTILYALATTSLLIYDGFKLALRQYHCPFFEN
jgi:hypothetical protein